MSATSTEAGPVTSPGTDPAPAGCLGHDRLMAELLDSLHVGLCLFDPRDRTLLWNRTFLRLFPEQAGHVVVGEPYAVNLRRFYEARLPAAERQAIDRYIAEGMARHRAQTHPYIFEHRGQWVRVAAQAAPGIGQLRIWTPIAPLGMLDALDDGRLGQDQAGWLRLARESAEALLGLLDNVLTFSRLGAGHVTTEQVPAGPARLLEALVRLMQPRAAKKGLVLRCTPDPDLPKLVLCDPTRLRQVLLNLIDNAVKFTERGEVTLAARRGGDLPDGRFLLEIITVADTGIGIPPAALDMIFEPFVQADSGISRRFGSTGLGLAICRQLVDAMGGQISATSTEDAGSCFPSPSPAGRRRRRHCPVGRRTTGRRCRRSACWSSTTIPSIATLPGCTCSGWA